MISTKNINILPLSRESISKLITDEQIFRKYIPHDFKIDEIFSAPYRVDRTPSFGIYYNEHVGKLFYKDLSKKDGGDCFKYVSKHVINNTLWEACKLINRDFNLQLGSYSNINFKNLPKFEHKEKEKKHIEIIKQEFTEIDITYWQQYGISLETLKFYNVFSCYEFYVNNEFRRRYTNNYPIYAYYFPRTNNYKIYIPNGNKYEKWFTNASNNWDVQGYDQLPEKDDLVYITKSMKDCMVLYELGYNAVATHGEGHYFNPDFIRHLKGRFKEIYSLYDQDEAGIVGANYLKKSFDIKSILIPLEYKCKDISDFRKQYSREECKILIQKLNESN